MPTYEYICECGFEFEVTKPFGQYDCEELCLKCGSVKTIRQMSRTHFYNANDWDKAQFNPGLGCVVKNKKHRDQLAKEKNLVEIGNESCDKICDSQDRKSDAILEEKTKASYDALEYGIKHDYLAKR